VIIHTAGFIDAGFSGQLTLEIANVGKMPVLIRAGSRICQLVLVKMTSEAANPYNKRKTSKYVNQAGPTSSRIGQDSL
jgi:dCTP deaminase